MSRLNPDFREMLLALSAEEAEFLVVGAYAVAAHGAPRATGDLDIWVATSGDNPERVFRALAQYGAPLANLNAEDLRSPDLIFQIGVTPLRVDIITTIGGVRFDEAYPRRLSVAMEGLTVPVLSLDDLIINKRAAGRPRDMEDVRVLETRRRA